METREVIFWFGDVDGFHPDMSQEELQKEEECTMERKGTFHCWTPAIVYNSTIGEHVPSIVAIIEDESGCCHEIDINHFRFVPLKK